MLRGHDAFLQHIQTVEREPEQDLAGITQNRLDGLWRAGVVAEVLGFVLPAVLVGVPTANGYGRQSRRWRQLEAEVKALRRGSRLLMIRGRVLI